MNSPEYSQTVIFAPLKLTITKAPSMKIMIAEDASANGASRSSAPDRAPFFDLLHERLSLE